MSRLPNIKLNKELLLMVLCVAGTVAVAWWAWAAGPVQPKSSFAGGTPAAAAQSLSVPAYGSVDSSDSSSAGSGSAGQAVSSPPSSGTTSSPVMPPAEPVPITPPTYPYCNPCGGAQPLDVCPYQSGSSYLRYPCCEYMDSSPGICGCRGTELLCAQPL